MLSLFRMISLAIIQLPPIMRLYIQAYHFVLLFIQGIYTYILCSSVVEGPYQAWLQHALPLRRLCLGAPPRRPTGDIRLRLLPDRVSRGCRPQRDHDECRRHDARRIHSPRLPGIRQSTTEDIRSERNERRHEEG